MIVEARERSGALITADFALESGRDVLAVPGEITSSRSAGTNALIRSGATPVVSIRALLADLGIDARPYEATALDPAARRVVDAVAAGSTTLDELGRALQLEPAAVSRQVTELELAGALEHDNGHYRVPPG